NCNWRLPMLVKPPKEEKLVFGPDGTPVAVPTPAKNGWFQMAATWNTEQNFRRLYLNGKLVDEQKYHYPHPPEEIMLGGPKTWNAQAYLDEVRILRRALSDAEIARDFQAQLAGQPFPSPAPTPFKVTIAPRHSQAEAAGEFPDCPDVRFASHFLEQDFEPDGNEGKPVWSIPSSEGFVKRDGTPGAVRSEIRFRHSDSSLYLCAVLWQEMDKMTAQYDQHDMPVWNDDCLEMFLDVPAQKTAFWQFVFNPIGAYADLCNGDLKQNVRNIQVKTARHNDRWILEARLPFASLGMPSPFIGDQISVRFNRSVRNPRITAGSLPQMTVDGNNRRICLGALAFQAGDVGQASLELPDTPATFALGCNHLRTKLTNMGETELAAELQLCSQNQFGHNTILSNQSISLPPQKPVTMNVEANISAMETRKLVLLLKSQGRTLRSLTLHPAFHVGPESYSTVCQETETLQRSTSHLRHLKHPLITPVLTALDGMADRLAQFQSRIDTALQNKTTVDNSETDELADWLNGFRDFVNQYRYLAWNISPWETGTPDALPPTNSNLRLAFEQAGNEREICCFALCGLLCGSRLDVRMIVESVQGKDTPFISTDNFEIYQEPFVNYAGDIITAPLVRTPGNFVTITPGETLRIWLMFNSAGVKPGKYETTLHIKPSRDFSVPVRHCPVTAHVWNFELPATHEWPIQSFFWGPNYFDNDETSMLRLMHSYHVTHGWTKSKLYSHGIHSDYHSKSLPKGKQFDEHLLHTANQEFFDTALKLKMKFVQGWGCPTTPEYYRLFSERMLKMGFSLDQFIFKTLIRDEFLKKDIPAMAEAREAVAKINPGWTFQCVYLSTPPPIGATIDDIEEGKLPEFYKMFTVIRNLLKDPKRGPEVIRRLKAKGCQVWSYECARYMQTQDILNYYRLYPWECRLMGLDGLAIWISLTPRGDDGFDSRDGYDDGALWRGLDKTPVTTKRFEAFREGLEDVAYMARLELELTRFKEKGLDSTELQQLLQQCEEILRHQSQDKVDQWRRSAGRAIHAACLSETK
ncbi:MAG: hypothetical protein IJJ33_03040, partial [Victivallales bacterium]|nr:hypothetical protein [Victivallales bacterium]